MAEILRYFLCGAMLLTSLNAFATDQSKDVSSPSMQKIVSGGISAHDRIFTIEGYCMEFSSIVQQMVGTTIKKWKEPLFHPKNF